MATPNGGGAFGSTSNGPVRSAFEQVDGSGAMRTPPRGGGDSFSSDRTPQSGGGSTLPGLYETPDSSGGDNSSYRSASRTPLSSVAAVEPEWRRGAKPRASKDGYDRGV